jgi:hypothetical protein
MNKSVANFAPHTKQEDALKSVLDQCEAASKKALVSFEAGFAIVQGRFDILRDFCVQYQQIQLQLSLISLCCVGRRMNIESVYLIGR